jgi:hypothetical protein
MSGDWILLAENRIQWRAVMSGASGLSVSVNGREFLDQLSDYQLSKMDSLFVKLSLVLTYVLCPESCWLLLNVAGVQAAASSCCLCVCPLALRWQTFVSLRWSDVATSSTRATGGLRELWLAGVRGFFRNDCKWRIRRKLDAKLTRYAGLSV